MAEINNTINDGTFGKTDTLDCADGKSLNIGGSKNTLTVKGRCASVIIGGDDNKITFDKVDTELTVAGLNNTSHLPRRRPDRSRTSAPATPSPRARAQMTTGLLPKLALATVAAVGLYISTLGLPLPGSCLRTIGVAGVRPVPVLRRRSA